MSTLKADAVTAKSTNTDCVVTGAGTGVPDIEAGFKVGGVAGVPTASIRDDAVTLAKLAAGTDGELITWDASGDPAAVAVGTATHVLTSNGAGAAPTFQAAGGLWSNTTASTLSAVASVELTSLNSETKLTRITLYITTMAAAPLHMQMYLNGSLETGSEYDWGHYLWTAYKAADAWDRNQGQNDTHMDIIDETTVYGNMWIEILLYPRSAGTPVCSWTGVTGQASGNMKWIRGGGACATSNFIDGVKLYPASGTITARYTVDEYTKIVGAA